MIDSAAFLAPASPPETGASSIRKPFSRACSARAAVTSGRMLEKSMIRVPGSACSKTPPSPARTLLDVGRVGHHHGHHVGSLDRLGDRAGGTSPGVDERLEPLG